MTKGFYPRLAASNLKKNAQTYLPYILTCICSVAMYYIVHALSRNPGAGSGTLQMVLSLGVYVMGIFSVLFLFYTNSFLMKRRKKEFGLFNILGMEKKHLFRIIFFENLYSFLISMGLGLAAGLLLSKLVHLFLLSLMHFPLRFGFFLSWESILSALALFGAIFVLLLLSSLWQIQVSRPIELIHGGQTGEREPKAKWFWALLGILCLGVGYGMSALLKDPLALLMLFFIAVILVIIGTYLLFTAGGVAFLKLLKRNKNYYYKANHFISVSGMMYRMKQNAAGLATICILSTMVLVMISSTAALYFGMEDALDDRFPREVLMDVYDYKSDGDSQEKMMTIVEETLADLGLEKENPLGYRLFPIVGIREGTQFATTGTYQLNDVFALRFVPLEDFAAFTGYEGSLAQDEVLLYSDTQRYGEAVLSVGSQTFRVISESFETLDFLRVSSAYNGEMTPVYYLVVRDIHVMEAILADVLTEEGGADSIRCWYGFDVGAEDETMLELHELLSQRIFDEDNFQGYIQTRALVQQEFLEVYGSLFFLGLFLGFVFILATVLIIYYKQISEGFDDKNRYSIMKKVGLDRRETKRSINSQILTMFFLPLVAACLHMVFAFPAISVMLSLLNLQNTALFVVSTLLSVVVFALFYVLVYSLTAKVYYKIVDAK